MSRIYVDLLTRDFRHWCIFAVRLGSEIQQTQFFADLGNDTETQRLGPRYRSEGIPMLHLYSAVLLAVVGANAFAVFLAVAIALRGKRDH